MRYVSVNIVFGVGYLGLATIAITTCAIVTGHLWGHVAYVPEIASYAYGECFLQSNFTDTDNYCTFAYALGMVTTFVVAVDVVTSFFRAFKTPLGNFVFSCVNFIWWILGVSVITPMIQKANELNVPQQYWRNVFFALCWVQLCFAMMCVFTSAILFSDV